MSARNGGNVRTAPAKAAVSQENNGVFGNVRVTERVEGADGKGMFVAFTGAHGQPFATFTRKGDSGSTFNIGMSKLHYIFADDESLVNARAAYEWMKARYAPAPAKATGKATDVVVFDVAAIAEAARAGVPDATIQAMIASGGFRLASANPTPTTAPASAPAKPAKAGRARARA